MPRLPRTSAAKTLATLQRMGFVIVRQRGSHIVLRCGTQGCVVPKHRELAVGTLRAILRQAGRTPEEFMEYFEG